MAWYNSESATNTPPQQGISVGIPHYVFGNHNRHNQSEGRTSPHSIPSRTIRGLCGSPIHHHRLDEDPIYSGVGDALGVRSGYTSTNLLPFEFFFSPGAAGHAINRLDLAENTYRGARVNYPCCHTWGRKIQKAHI